MDPKERTLAGDACKVVSMGICGGCSVVNKRKAGGKEPWECRPHPSREIALPSPPMVGTFLRAL